RKTSGIFVKIWYGGRRTCRTRCVVPEKEERMKSDVLFLNYVIFRVRKPDNARVLSSAISKNQKADNTQGSRLGKPFCYDSNVFSFVRIRKVNIICLGKSL
uniref:Uncharacterized protein n=1 Tax=Clytia hemisphaerica TaxID=252671 RepID=A0A7M6DJQ2_9CNID